MQQSISVFILSKYKVFFKLSASDPLQEHPQFSGLLDSDQQAQPPAQPILHLPDEQFMNKPPFKRIVYTLQKFLFLYLFISTS
ncbi:hypothetical protein [Bacillus toyonensis]|uniref:hypothetical protein n=1 Tax=Bacillus toyonensis TaxID=155322 RepID=UPI001155CA98|nr:hypothetical protein [Bacillus toyonensis]